MSLFEIFIFLLIVCLIVVFLKRNRLINAEPKNDATKQDWRTIAPRIANALKEEEGKWLTRVIDPTIKMINEKKLVLNFNSGAWKINAENGHEVRGEWISRT